LSFDFTVEVLRFVDVTSLCAEQLTLPADSCTTSVFAAVLQTKIRVQTGFPAIERSCAPTTQLARSSAVAMTVLKGGVQSLLLLKLFEIARVLRRFKQAVNTHRACVFVGF